LYTIRNNLGEKMGGREGLSATGRLFLTLRSELFKNKDLTP
jgi:hypothetical protein